MPDVAGSNPVLQDVRFDPAAALTVAAECHRAGALLAELIGHRLHLATRAREHWRGRHRREFDENLRWMTAEVTQISDDLLRIAGDLAQATDEAQLEQLLREQTRQQLQTARDTPPGPAASPGGRQGS
jgi:hypothetical protein